MRDKNYGTTIEMTPDELVTQSDQPKNLVHEGFSIASSAVANCFMSAFDSTDETKIDELIKDLGISFVPILGDANDGAIAVFGHNFATGKSANCLERVLSSAGLGLTAAGIGTGAGAGAATGCVVTTVACPVGVVGGGAAGATTGYFVTKIARKVITGMIHNFAKKLFSQIASIGKIFVNSKNLLQGAKKLLFETTKGVWEGNLTRRGSIINIATVVGESYSNGVRVIQNIDNLQVLLKPITKIVENVVEGCLKTASGRDILPNTIADNSLFDKSFASSFVEEVIGIGGLSVGAGKVPCLGTLEEVLEAIDPFTKNITNTLASNAAFLLGYTKVPNKQSAAGTAIFQRNGKIGPKFISNEKTRHTGGFWKGASSSEILETTTGNILRDGTYDIYLNWIAK